MNCIEQWVYNGWKLDRQLHLLLQRVQWLQPFVPFTYCLIVDDVVVWETEQLSTFMPICLNSTTLQQAPKTLSEVGFSLLLVIPMGGKYMPATMDTVFDSIRPDPSDQLLSKNWEHPAIDGQPPLASSLIGGDDGRTKVQNWGEKWPPNLRNFVLFFRAGIHRWWNLVVWRTCFL